MVNHATATVPPVPTTPAASSDPATPDPAAPGTDAGELLAELGTVLAERRITPVYQPIVDLASGDTVAFEAPRGTRQLRVVSVA